MTGMSRFVALTAALGLAGCAHAAAEQAPPREERVVVAVDEPQPTVAPPTETPETPAPARRLSRTITLGQTEAYAPVPEAQAAQGGPGVVVNNNITVVTPPPVVYAYGGYGYDYGYGYGYGGGPAARDVDRPSTGSAPPIGSPASVGRGSPAAGTPAVGGSWPSAPSYGPRTNR